MTLYFMLLLVFLAALLATAGLRQYALKSNVMDVPNDRSSHSIPTPRGGGVAIVLVFLLSVFAAWSTGSASISIFAAIAGGGGLVAVVGFLDDHGHIAARWRLLCHFASALWIVLWLGGGVPLQIGGETYSTGWLGAVAGVFYLVWLLNLYNFMDGINGIASAEAICTGLGATLAYFAVGERQNQCLTMLLIASVAGFMYWNFPRAKIFMGDAGSGFLGIAIGALSLQATWAYPQLLWSWLILLGVFIVDATVTLLRRLLRGERVYEAHRSHAYQFASRRVGRHAPVTWVVIAINLAWLCPLAVLVACYKLDGLWALVVAYVPLVLMALKFNAGGRE